MVYTPRPKQTVKTQIDTTNNTQSVPMQPTDTKKQVLNPAQPLPTSNGQPLSTPSYPTKTNTVTGQQYYPEHVMFNPDNTVTVTKGGKTTTQPVADYNASLPTSKMGGNTENVNAIKDVQATQPETPQIGLTADQIAQAENQANNTPVDVGQALTAGTIKNFPNLAKGLVYGAGGGALATAPISAALAATGVGALPAGAIALGGAIVGGIGAIWSGVQQNIANQQKGEIGAAQDVLSSAKTDMRLLATLAAKDPANSERYIEAYNKRLAQVYQARAKIKLETQGNLNKFTEDGTDILSNFDLFLQPNGTADLYKNRLALALSKGVAPDFTEEDLANLK